MKINNSFLRPYILLWLVTLMGSDLALGQSTTFITSKNLISGEDLKKIVLVVLKRSYIKIQLKESSKFIYFMPLLIQFRIQP